MSSTPEFAFAAVAAPHSAACATGQDILAQGGNALEAMVAMAATMAVVYPHMNGMGGDGVWLIREPGGKVRCLEALGFAGERAARGNCLFMPELEMAADRGGLAGKTKRLKAADLSAGLTDQPRPVAAYSIHMRINDRDGGGHGDHGFERVAPLGENVLPGYASGAMGGGDGGERKFRGGGHKPVFVRGGVLELAVGPSLIYVLWCVPHRGQRPDCPSGARRGREETHQLAKRADGLRRGHSRGH